MLIMEREVIGYLKKKKTTKWPEMRFLVKLRNEGKGEVKERRRKERY